MHRHAVRAAVTTAAALTLMAAPLSAAQAAEVTPTGGSGNPDCADLLPAGAYAAEHIAPSNASVATNATVGPITFKDVKENGEEEAISFDFISDKPVVMVIVKGGANSAYNEYDYRSLDPSYVMADPDGDPADNTGDLTTRFGQGISHVTFCVLHDPPDVTVEASGDFTRTTSWDLLKTADGDDDGTTRTGAAGGNAGEPVDWDVDLTRTDTDSGHEMSGTALIENPNQHEVTGTVSGTFDGAALPVDCDSGTAGVQSSFAIPAGEDLTCTFAASEDGTTVEVDVDATSPGTPDSSDSTTVDWAAPTLVGAQTVVVDDDREDGTQFPTDDVATSDSWTYDEQFTCPADTGQYGDDEVLTFEVVNTATAVGDDVDLSDPAEVAVTCTTDTEVLSGVVTTTTPTTTPPTVLPFVPDAAAGQLPTTGPEHVLSMALLGLGTLLIGALLIGAGRRRDA